jgi:Tol biopolymer transport system component
VQTKGTNKAYVLDAAGPQSAPAEPLALQARDLLGLSWSVDGKLLVTDGSQLWTTDPDGKNPVQLASDSHAVMTFPAACGTYIVFGWRFHEASNSGHIWRTNADGSNPVPLTSGGRDLYPTCSPDQKWVYYLNLDAEQIWRVPLDGSGKPEGMPAANDFRGFLDGSEMSVSADGKTLAYTVDVVDAKTQIATNKIAMLRLEAPQSLRLLDVDQRITGPVQFTPDGKAIAYPVRENGVDNIWVEPLDGSAGHPITHFTAEQIDSLHWSPDGKKLALIRGHSESDVVLLQEAKR